MENNPLFYAKILLFGEYGIINNSMGLSIPFNFYQGALHIAEESGPEQTASRQSLEEYYAYLVEAQASQSLPVQFDLAALRADLDRGLVFDSSIPQGFGVGSSGALVAALYQRYALQPIDPQEALHGGQILTLKTQFSALESYFHGKSSGLDPLICYLNLPVLIKSREDLSTVNLPAQGVGSGAIFLLNSGAPGKTQPMVNIFLEKLKHDGFRSMLKEFIRYNDACIHAFLQGDTKPLFKNLKKLSALVVDHFQPMIPQGFEEVWRKGIRTNSYYLKLCGSGGGGYILGFTQDLEQARKALEPHRLEVIHRF
jgi:mevalonate kinase